MIPFGANIQGAQRARARLPIWKDAEFTGWERVPRGGELRRLVYGDGNRGYTPGEKRRLSADAGKEGLVLLFGGEDVIRFHGCGELFHA